jgi:hypothetical protein
MSEPSVEDTAKAGNVVKQLQARLAKQDAKSASADTRRERVEQTWGADARKTRDLIRGGRHTSLPVLARMLVPFIGDKTEKHLLEEALENFLAANHEYRRVEELPPAILDWIGPPNGRIDLPANAPDHKRDLVNTWHALLNRVNELSKVGIIKPVKPLLAQEPTAIELLVDLGDEPQAAPAKWD